MQEPILNGRYRLGQTIGEGGMAVVYLGRDLLLNREVAVKILREQYSSDESFLKRFEREGQIAAGMTHPNIVSVFDVGHDEGQHYIVMEFIRGPNLKELIHRQGPFSVDGAVFIISQVAAALDYAHQRGLVHRDIKPQNILVDRDGNAKVVDFGIAKGMRDQNLTEAGTGMGTVHYVSPEQARGDEVGPPSDLYSTGIVLYEMLTKALPFDADTPVGVAMHHVNTPPPRPSASNPNIPPQIDSIVLKALAKAPNDRFASGAALESALRHWDDPRIQQEMTQGARQQPQRAPSGPPERAAPRNRGAGPPPRRRRRRRAVPPPPPERSSGVGCGTWLIGVLMLVLIVGAVLAALEYGPDLFESSRNEASPTATEDVAANEGTEDAVNPSPTDEPTATEEPTATIAPTETPEPTPTEATAGTVPNLLNSTVPEARVALAGQWDLEIQEDFNSDVEEGLIFDQDPAEGQELEFDEPVTVWVSLGTEIVSIPDVTGFPLDAAEGELEAAGFATDVIDEPSEEFGEGEVIRTEPAGEAPVDETIVIVVSIGDVVEIPDVFGTDVFLARDELTEAGLVVRNVIPRGCDFLERANDLFNCDDVGANEVVAISTGGEGAVTWGDIVPRGTTVDIIYLQSAQSP